MKTLSRGLGTLIPWGLTLTLSVMAGGCYFPSQEAKPQPKAKASLPAVPPSAKAPLPEIILPQIEEKKASPSLFSISVNEMEVREVLQVFAQESKLSLVIDPEVKGKVTVDLKQVSFDQVLSYLLDPLDLDYSREGNVLRVSTRKLKTRIFNVNYLTAKRQSAGSISVSGGGGGSSGGNAPTANGSITSSNDSDFWKVLEEQLKMLVEQSPVKEGLNEKPSVIINRENGVILAKATEKTLRQVAQFLELVSNASQRQVHIQAKIVEVRLNESNQFGIDWQRNSDRIFGSDVVLKQALSTAASPVTATFNSDKTTAVLTALNEEGDVNILSSPSISTLNNQSAIIKVAREEVAFRIKSSTTQGQSNATTSEEAEVKKVTVGLSLKVTPQISENDVIMMEVHPAISELIRLATAESNGRVLAVEPVVDVREVNAVVQAKTGETVVIGGLIRDQFSDNNKEVPILSSIPLLGNLFKNKSKSNTKSELVIFLTPTLVSGQAMNELSQKQKDQFETYNAEMFNRL